MSDLIERLRDFDPIEGALRGLPIQQEAADEIERLTAECHKYHVNINGMQTTLDDQAERIANLEDAINDALVNISPWTTNCDYRAETDLRHAVNFLTEALANKQEIE